MINKNKGTVSNRNPTEIQYVVCILILRSYPCQDGRTFDMTYLGVLAIATWYFAGRI